MPLLKLWNTLLGRSQGPDSAPKSTGAANTSGAGAPTGTDSMTPVGAATKTAATAADATPQKKRTSRKSPAPARRGILKMTGFGPYAALCKLVRPLRPGTVLDISVGDGSRTISVAEELAAKNDEVRYAVIDQFEMGDSTTSLKSFHQALRAAGVRAQLFPESLERGLLSVLRTIGTVDLVLIGCSPEKWQNEKGMELLARVTHPSSVILHCDSEGNWQRWEPGRQAGRRAA